MKRIFMILMLVVISASGCAGKRHYPTTTTTVPRYEDPAVTVARGLATQTASDRVRWQRVCLELRSHDPYATYEDCRRVFGDDRKIGYKGYGNSFRIQKR